MRARGAGAETAACTSPARNAQREGESEPSREGNRWRRVQADERAASGMGRARLRRGTAGRRAMGTVIVERSRIRCGSWAGRIRSRRHGGILRLGGFRFAGLGRVRGLGSGVIEPTVVYFFVPTGSGFLNVLIAPRSPAAHDGRPIDERPVKARVSSRARVKRGRDGKESVAEHHVPSAIDVDRPRVLGREPRRRLIHARIIPRPGTRKILNEHDSARGIERPIGSAVESSRLRSSERRTDQVTLALKINEKKLLNPVDRRIVRDPASVRLVVPNVRQSIHRRKNRRLASVRAVFEESARGGYRAFFVDDIDAVCNGGIGRKDGPIIVGKKSRHSTSIPVNLVFIGDEREIAIIGDTAWRQTRQRIGERQGH
jgi:hypothetical protein